MTDNKITRETTFSEELPYFKERIKEISDNYDNPDGYADVLYLSALSDSNRIVRKAEEEINRQQVQNKRLEKEVNLVSIQFQDLQERYEESQAEIERLRGSTIVNNIMESQRIKREAKAEAVKEFAEKLKEKSFKTIRNYGLTKDVVEVSTINNLLKEMVGDDNA